MECKKIELGYNRARVVFDDVHKMDIDFSNISSFSVDDMTLTNTCMHFGIDKTGL